MPPSRPVPDAVQAAWLLALDPVGLGGLCLRGPPGPGREHTLASLRVALPEGTAWRRLPAATDDEALSGGLDLGLSLAAGRPVRRAGLLAELGRGVLLLPQAERLDRGLAARLAAALEPTEAEPGAGPMILALDEGEGPDEAAPAALLERLAMVVTAPEALDRLQATDLDAPPPLAWPPPFELEAARARLPQMAFDAVAVEALCEAAAALGLASMRAPWQAWAVARAAAASQGRVQVDQDDLELAARLVLAPRARCLPAPPADAAPAEPPDAVHEDEPPPPDRPPRASEAAQEPPADPEHGPGPEPPPPPSEASPEPPAEALSDRLVEAARAALPPGWLERLAAGAGLAPRGRGATGRGGAPGRTSSQGRPLASRRGPLRGQARLDLLATVRAALPWQRLRLQERERLGLGPAPGRLLLRTEDLHLRRHRRPCETTTVFVVDASGSQALHRLAEAKGAVELLLADCYVRRDRVALIAFRGTEAETLLAPTRSLVRARRSLAALPGGGGTPLAAGIDAAWALAQGVQAREGGRPVLVFLTDARANIARDGQPGRQAATEDALASARRLAAAAWRSLLIDTSPRPQPAAQALAGAMGAAYVALPQGRAEAVFGAVSRLMG